MHFAIQFLAVLVGLLALLTLLPQPAEKPYWAYTQCLALLLAAGALFAVGHG